MIELQANHRLLCLYVIRFAQIDAVEGETKGHRQRAVKWLTEGSKDFLEVCTLGGLTPEEAKSIYEKERRKWKA